jgi:hypothetical protein
VTPHSSAKPSGSFPTFDSFFGSNFSKSLSLIPVTRGPGSSTKTSKGGAPRDAFTLAIWSTAKSGCISRSTSCAFFSAGTTMAR